jgi:hypothetical protein
MTLFGYDADADLRAFNDAFEHYNRELEYCTARGDRSDLPLQKAWYVLKDAREKLPPWLQSEVRSMPDRPSNAIPESDPDAQRRAAVRAFSTDSERYLKAPSPHTGIIAVNMILDDLTAEKRALYARAGLLDADPQSEAGKRQRELTMDNLDLSAPAATQGPVFGSEFHPHGTTPAVVVAGTETPTNESASKRVPIDDPLERRVAMVSGGYPHPGATLRAMNEVTDVSEQYAQSLRQIFKRNKVDTGRAIAAIDHVQQTKNIAMDALSLPYVTKSAE